jgi:hypothetical protein
MSKTLKKAKMVCKIGEDRSAFSVGAAWTPRWTVMGAGSCPRAGISVAKHSSSGANQRSKARRITMFSYSFTRPCAAPMGPGEVSTMAFLSRAAPGD